MDYITVVQDLNSDLQEEFGVESLIDGFEYTYITSCGVDRIEFCGVEIFNSENYHGVANLSEITIPEFEDYLEENLFQIGEKFMKCSFIPSDILKLREELHNAEVYAGCMEARAIAFEEIHDETIKLINDLRRRQNTEV